MCTVVVLPAPFGPSRPKIVPAGTCRSMPSRTTWSPNDLRSPAALIASPAALLGVVIVISFSSGLSAACWQRGERAGAGIYGGFSAVSGRAGGAETGLPAGRTENYRTLLAENFRKSLDALADRADALGARTITDPLEEGTAMPRKALAIGLAGVFATAGLVALAGP